LTFLRKYYRISLSVFVVWGGFLSSGHFSKEGIDMKKVKTLSMVLFLVVVASLFTVEASAKTAIETQADKMTTQFVDAANYWGYGVTTKVVSRTSTKVVKRLDCRCSRYLWTNVQQITTKTTWSGYVTKFKYKGTEYDLNLWKKMFSRYKGTTADIKKIVKQRATAKGDAIIKYAKSNRWTIRSTKLQTGNNVATATIYVQNKRYAYGNSVTVTRKNNKFYYSYKRNGATSTLDGIKDWLSRFKV